MRRGALHDELPLGIPDAHICLGMFVVDCSAIRSLLVQKHGDIIEMLLKHLVVLTHKLAKHMVKEFDAVALKLSEIPQDKRAQKPCSANWQCKSAATHHPGAFCLLLRLVLAYESQHRPVPRSASGSGSACRSHEWR